VENRIVAGHEELPPEFVNSFVFVNGRISIVPDVTVFVRGDSNRNGRVELADAQSTLNHLFLGGPPPRCHDASDANDDGKLDISDPVGVLNFLFLGGGPLPPPAGSPGPDPSPDSLPGCGNRD
jgi:hypothetical protein